MNNTQNKPNDLMKCIIVNHLLLMAMTNDMNEQLTERAEIRGMITALRYTNTITNKQANDLLQITTEILAGVQKFHTNQEAGELVYTILAD